MTPNERTDFLAWLMRLDVDQLREVNSHVNSMMTHKRGARLRLLGPGSQIVFSVGKGLLDRAAGTVVKMFKTSVEVESAMGERCRVEVDAILGLHTGGMDYAPLESAQPLGFPQVPQVVDHYIAGHSPVADHPLNHQEEFSTARDGLPGGDLEDFNPPIDWEPSKE